MEPSGPVTRAASAPAASPPRPVIRAASSVRAHAAVRARLSVRARFLAGVLLPVRPERALAAVLLSAVALLPVGCADSPAGSPPAATTAPPTASEAVNDVDVMFLQMGLAQLAEGEKVAALAEQRAGNAAIRALAAELRAQWKTESGTMERWLLGWSKPVTADPSAGAHAGHGELHALRPADLAELTAAQGADFDRMAVSLLLGNLHNGMETLRLEASSGAYPPARDLAAEMTTRRQSHIQQLLKLAA
ncbi:uncharacterized protein (DUF305 family) [Actinoplanes octamycinicus]|uniref:Uncharacterized protein (DUF305 family) n=1 Tax=Actinoplanes octamycinicus TaxID=135948 RepID=A0A7W7MC16_9ACTN|nr:DUF305 domain-containing protein [Actinoplanes octamycinicus]MBB4744360.1 uncharacterized protein (DUF305 family) [Actinoplanes octamycinicus]